MSGVSLDAVILEYQSMRTMLTLSDLAETHSELHRQSTPDLAAIHCLLGKLHHGNDDKRSAIEAYTMALKLNPFMWDAFTGLCELGIGSRSRCL